MVAAANAMVLPSGRDPGTHSTHDVDCAASENHPTPRQRGDRAPGRDEESPWGCSQHVCGNPNMPGEVSQISGNSKERADAYDQEHSEENHRRRTPRYGASEVERRPVGAEAPAHGISQVARPVELRSGFRGPP
jgi:hypothetical protein